MESLERILSEHPFFKDLSPEYITLITGCAANGVFQEGEFLFKEGDPADKFFVIRRGKVMVETHVPNRGPVAIQSREAGEVLGWSWLVPPYQWHFDAKAVEQTRALVFDGKCLRDKFADNHDLGYEILQRFVNIIAERLDATRLQLMDVYGND